MHIATPNPTNVRVAKYAFTFTRAGKRNMAHEDQSKDGTLTTLHSFAGPDGSGPFAGLVLATK